MVRGDKSSSKDTILKLARGVETGWVEIIPLNLVTIHVLTWLYSKHTDSKYFSDNVTLVTGDLSIMIYIIDISHGNPPLTYA